MIKTLEITIKGITKDNARQKLSNYKDALKAIGSGREYHQQTSIQKGLHYKNSTDYTFILHNFTSRKIAKALGIAHFAL